MEEHICGKKAVSKVFWVDGKDINMCEEHEAQIRRLCAAMGWALTLMSLGETEKICESKTGS